MKSETESTLSQQDLGGIDIPETGWRTPLMIPNYFVSSENALSSRLMEAVASSQPNRFHLPQVNRVNRIRLVRGKYSFVQTSSDEFAKRKQTEICVEGQPLNDFGI